MAFVRSLHDIYYDIYKLVRLGFTAEYVENISPAERGVFLSYHKMEQNQLKNSENAKAAEMVGLNIEDLL